MHPKDSERGNKGIWRKQAFYPYYIAINLIILNYLGKLPGMFKMLKLWLGDEELLKAATACCQKGPEDQKKSNWRNMEAIGFIRSIVYAEFAPAVCNLTSQKATVIGNRGV